MELLIQVAVAVDQQPTQAQTGLEVLVALE
jgi:hypothetical protein